MPEVLNSVKSIRGGEFLVKETKASEVFIPEQFDEEQSMISDTVRDFIETRIFPNTSKIEQQKDGIGTTLME